MKIGYDAKRLFTNFTGLGNYSRSLVHHYHSSFPSDELFLFTPSIKADKRTEPFLQDQTFHIVQPAKKNPFWRTFDMVKAIQQTGVEIYHGLSHELPVGISRVDVGRVVTIHDLIFKYYTGDHPWLDRKIYDWKWKHACRLADKIVAISEQTKNDLIQYYAIPPEKIEVIYQSADPVFSKLITDEDVATAKKKYKLPQDYNLYVGSVISRKNLLSIIRAMSSMPKADQAPLVIIGDGKEYKNKIIAEARKANIGHLLIWLHKPVFADFPAIYKGAAIMIYPSFHEGFGLPVIEAMHTGIPVITSDQSSLKEAGGDAAVLVNPSSVEQLRHAIIKVQSDSALRHDLVSKGNIHLEKFDPATGVQKYHDVYKSVLSGR